MMEGKKRRRVMAVALKDKGTNGGETAPVNHVFSSEQSCLTWFQHSSKKVTYFQVSLRILITLFIFSNL